MICFLIRFCDRPQKRRLYCRAEIGGTGYRVDNIVRKAELLSKSQKYGTIYVLVKTSNLDATMLAG